MSSSSGSSTVVMTSNGPSLSNSLDLSSSTSSLSPSRSGSQHLTKVYKQASQLFLTRRLGEALSVLEPVLSAPQRTTPDGRSTGDDELAKAPVATASISQRTRIWSLYITLLNSIVDLTDEEGTQEIGHKKLKEIEQQVRSGQIWETVVQDGYGGREGSVDSDVVYNLTTLMLGQASSQIQTQQRLETYLASSPDLDVSGHLQRSPSRRSKTNGTNTPRDLSSRLKVLELFTLHVLPRNDEWDYARSFISNSDILDEERREAFLQTLEELKEEQEAGETEEVEKLAERHLSPNQQNGIEPTAEASTPPSNSAPSISTHKRSTSEVDYGIESAQSISDTLPVSRQPEISSGTKILTPRAEPPAPSNVPSKPNGRMTKPTPTNVPPRSKNVRKPNRPDALQQGRNLLRTLQNLMTNMTAHLTGHPAAILRTLLFLIALLSVFGQGQVRDRLRRVMGNSWDKIKNTVGMGVKVSYI